MEDGLAARGSAHHPYGRRFRAVALGQPEPAVAGSVGRRLCGTGRPGPAAVSPAGRLLYWPIEGAIAVVHPKDAHDLDAISRFAHDVGERLGDWVEDLILFGSRARGTAAPESDWDVVAIVSQRDLERASALAGLGFDYLLSDRLNISIKCFPRSEWDRQRRLGVPFVQNVIRDGRTLWTRTSTSSSAPS